MDINTVFLNRHLCNKGHDLQQLTVLLHHWLLCGVLTGDLELQSVARLVEDREILIDLAGGASGVARVFALCELLQEQRY
jgi:hypothetical protein